MYLHALADWILFKVCTICTYTNRYLHSILGWSVHVLVCTRQGIRAAKIINPIHYKLPIG